MNEAITQPDTVAAEKPIRQDPTGDIDEFEKLRADVAKLRAQNQNANPTN